MKSGDMKHSSRNNGLYGVSPAIIAEIMGFATLLTPYATIPAQWSWIFLSDIFYPTDLFYSVLWVFTPRTYNSLLIAFLHPQILWFTVPYSLFNILFAVKVVRYYQGRTSKLSVVIYGLISLVMPSIMLTALLSIASFDLLVLGIVWPIPIQFLVGLAILHRVRGPASAPEEEDSVRKVTLTMEELDDIYE